jgi:hypothetical protein
MGLGMIRKGDEIWQYYHGLHYTHGWKDPRWMAHGLSEEEIQKVWGGNFLKLLQRTIDRKA